MRAEFIFGGYNTIQDSSSIGNPKFTPDRRLLFDEAADIVNFDVDSSNNLTVRKEGVLHADVSAGSTIQVGDTTYCVSGGVINTLAAGVLSPIDALTVALDTEFIQANDVVVFSDGTTLGIIESDGTVTEVSNATDWSSVSNVDTWVASHYPADPANWDGVNSNSNFSVDTFKLPTFAGKCLAFHEGALYLAVNNFVFKSKTFDIESMDIRYNVVAGFSSDVTLVAPVTGGLFIGTETGTYYLTDDSQRKISDYGVIYRSGVEVPGNLVPELGLSGVLRVWATSAGVFAGGDGGKFVHLSPKLKEMIPIGATVAATFRVQDGAYHYLLCSSGEALAVNLTTGTHSRYTNFDYNYFYSYQGVNYGVADITIDRFAASTTVVAYVTTPNTDFLLNSQFAPEDVYVNTLTTGDMEVKVIADGVEYDAAPLMGSVKRRGKLPRGLKPNRCQFKITTLAGSNPKIASLEVFLNPLSRVV